MISHKEISDIDLRRKIRQKEILFGGNQDLKIYGKLLCKSGKRMKREHRVFFVSRKEAVERGYRPCGHCMKREYKKWKDGSVR
jgi:methylphosphotriester-DNA--protein-cysteine methyltransferase